MLDTIFADLCEGGPLIGPAIWESSRFTIAPIGLRGVEVMRLSQYLALAHVEFALLNGITRYTMIGEVHRVATVVSMGWRVRPLCLPRDCEGSRIQALEVTIDDDALASMRRRFPRARARSRDADRAKGGSVIPDRFRDLAAGDPLDPLTLDLIRDGYAIARGALPSALLETISAELEERFARTPFCVGPFHGLDQALPSAPGAM
jgi:hypothetical protein